jgi:hypothetical protein
MARLRPLLGALLVAQAAGCVLPQHPARPADESPAITVVFSIDALAEQRLRETLPPGTMPTLEAIFEQGACSDGSIGAFPSGTAAGHAALWTGAWGDVSGISANAQPRLPRDRHTLLDLTSGFLVDGLRAEQIWVTAARAGIPVATHHVTQAPQAPPFTPLYSYQGDPGAARRAAAARDLSRERVLVLNGYNRRIAWDAVITEEVSPARPAVGWGSLEALGSTVPPLEFRWAVASDTLFALVFGAESYTSVLVSPRREVGAGVRVTAAPLETGALPGRELARHFSAPLQLTIAGDPVAVRFRLFHLAPEGSSFRLYHSALHAVEGSDPALTERYVREVGGWHGNGALGLLRRGAFGEPISRGGDGTAELHYLETAELLTRQYMAGAEWVLREIAPRLFLDYFPLGDEIDHEFFGMVDPDVPGHDPVLAARAQRVRERGWELVDRRLERLHALVRSRPGSAIFLSGDHGMRSSWQAFRPNAALREAGLLALDEDGRIDLSRTLAVAPNGYWINVNGTDRLGGIVPPERHRLVVDSAARVLAALRDASGEAIVTRLFLPEEHPDLGIGGPAGGDLYFGLARGYHWSSDPRGPVLSSGRPEGKHGYPSMEPDMHTAFCMAGPGIGARRIPTARSIDLAPTVAEWLGIPAPADARGRSLLGHLTGDDR